ncbi:MAG: hypothetical protein ABUS56_11005 [Acidobacteriota bacterium]
MAGADANRRGSERLPLVGELDGEVMIFQPMVVTEIGATGAQVETSFPLHLDSLHDFRLALGDRSVIVKGRVVHSHISDVDQDTVLYRSGIEFVEMSDRVAGVILAFLETVKAGRAT